MECLVLSGPAVGSGDKGVAGGQLEQPRLIREAGRAVEHSMGWVGGLQDAAGDVEGGEGVPLTTHHPDICPGGRLVPHLQGRLEVISGRSFSCQCSPNS